MSILAENTINEIAYAGGYYSNKPISTTSTITGASSVISGQGATVSLTTAQSGSLLLFDRAAGITYTLPSPSAGTYYTFMVTVSVTSNSDKIVTNTASQYLMGSLTNIKTDLTSLFSITDGTSIRSITMNGTTTGALLGSIFYFYAVNSTQWLVDGTNLASGTIATPFATS